MTSSKLPTIDSYGKYHGRNYGLNCLMVSFGTFVLYYSYETIVAFSTPELGLLVRENEWSTTTGKHLNWIDGGDKKNRLNGGQFEALLHDTLKAIRLETVSDSEHVHEWTRTHAGDTDERLYRCETCGATLDSDGGII